MGQREERLFGVGFGARSSLSCQKVHWSPLRALAFFFPLVTYTLSSCNFVRAKGELISRSECSCSLLGSCPSKSARNGVAPPVQQTVSHCATGSTRDAKVVAHTVDDNRVHRLSHAEETHLAMNAGTSLALAMESCRRSRTLSSAQRLPVSMPRTSSLQRLAVSSGYVVSLSLRAWSSTAP